MAVDLITEVSPDDAQMRAFLLFKGDKYYAEGGAYDLYATADTVEELRPLIEPRAGGMWWAHIVEHATMNVIEEQAG